MTSTTEEHSHSESEPVREDSAPPPRDPVESSDVESEVGGEGADSHEPSRPGRPNLVDARLEHEPGSRLRVSVTLERGGRECEELLHGVGDEVMALRMAAQATIAALEQITGHPGHFSLVGIKTIRAFDADVVLACVRTKGDPPQNLMGSVPATGDLTRGAAKAVLHATNRLVELLAPPAETET